MRNRAPAWITRLWDRRSETPSKPQSPRGNWGHGEGCAASLASGLDGVRDPITKFSPGCPESPTANRVRRIAVDRNRDHMTGKTKQSTIDRAGSGASPQGLRVVAPPADGAPMFDASEIQKIWRDHRRWVAAILLAHKPREVDVEDLLQVVAVSVVRKIGELRDPSAVKPWLRTVAINAARASGRDVQRTRRHLKLVRERAHVGGEGAESVATAEGVTRREEADALMALARTLPEGYREPLLMRCVRGMSYKQIGAVLDLPETTIETRIARGRRMLRELATQKADREKASGDQALEASGASPGNREAPARVEVRARVGATA